ncbi:MAG: MSCRAMM family protein [Erysipelotrichaceae bacterium]
MKKRTMLARAKHITIAFFTMLGTLSFPMQSNAAINPVDAFTNCIGGSTGTADFKKVIGNKPVDGVVFDVFYYENGVRVDYGTVVSNNGGVVKIVDQRLVKDNIMYFQEVDGPDGLVMDATVYTLDGHNGGSCRMQNSMQSVGIVVNKQSTSENNGDAILTDGVFRIYAVPTGGTALDTLVYRDDTVYGSGYFSTRAFTVGSTYYIEEVVAPTGYQTPSPTRIAVTLAYGDASYNQFYYNPVVISNSVISRDITIQKVGVSSDPEEADVVLADVTFTLTLQSNPNIVYTQTTDTNGNLTFANIPYGRYVLKETVYPENYIPAQDQLIVVDANSPNPITLVIANTEKPRQVTYGRFDFTKVIETSDLYSNATLEEVYANITFGLYAPYDYTTPGENPITIPANQLIQTFTVSSDGRLNTEGYVSYTGLFYLKELTTHPDFSLNTTPINLIVGPKGTTVLDVSTMDNTLMRGSITVVKQDDTTNTKLAGATFELYKDGTLVDTMTTLADGIARFENLVPGSYVVKESKAPTNYYLNTTEFPLEVTNINLNPQIVVMNKEQKGEIIVYKYLENTETPMAGMEFGLYVNNKQVATATSDANGVAKFTNLSLGIYTVKELVVSGYLNSGDQTVTLSFDETKTVVEAEVVVINTPVTNGVIINKVDADNNIKPIEGVTFNLYKGDIIDENQLVGSITTGVTGIAALSGLEPGNYIAVETIAAPGYVLDTTPRPFTISETANTNVTITVENSQKPGAVRLIKTASELGIIGLEGVVFALYQDGVAIRNNLTTDENGEIVVDELSPGTYSFVETQGLAGYETVANPIVFTIEFNQQTTKEVVVNNLVVRGSVGLHKVDFDADGISIQGATFTLYQEEGEVVEANLITDINGNIVVNDLLPGTYYFQETNAAPGYQLDATTKHFVVVEFNPTTTPIVVVENNQIRGSVVLTKFDEDDNDKRLAGVTFALYDDMDNELVTRVTDDNGRIVIDDLLPGSYYFKEVSAPIGYIVDSESKYGFTIEFNQQERVSVEVRNRQTRGSAQLLKVNADRENTVIEGATFNLYRNGVLYYSGYKTSSDGLILVNELLAGEYYFLETSPAPGYQESLKEYFFTIEPGSTSMVEVEATNNEITGNVLVRKVDAKNADITLSGAEFAIYEEGSEVPLRSGLTTTSKGELIIVDLKPGTYNLVETKPPLGYEANTTPIAFEVQFNQQEILEIVVENQQILGSVMLEKVDLDQNKQPIPGVSFALYDENDEMLGSYATNEMGQIEIADLYPGSYYFMEVSAPTGYVFNPEMRWNFEIAFNPTKTEIVTVGNEQKTGGVILQKIDEATEEPISGVVFDLYQGEVKLDSNLITNQAGLIEVNDLKPGSYYFVETKAALGYKIEQSEIPFEIVFNQETPLFVSVSNQMIMGSVQIIKYGETQEVLPGVTFVLKDSQGNVLENLTTNEAGFVESKQIPYGTYTVEEIETVTGYVLDSQVRSVNIVEPEQVVVLEINNALIRGSFELTKVDATTGRVLAGASFEVKDVQGATLAILTTDVNGKAVLSDLVYGAYTITEIIAPRGYQLNATPVPFEIRNDNEVVRITLRNNDTRIAMRQIIFTKAMETSDLYANDLAYQDVRFGVYTNETMSIMNNEGVFVTYEAGSLLKELAIDENGQLIVDNLMMVEGSFYLQEIKTHADYVLDPTKYPFTVSAENTTALVSLKPVVNQLQRSDLIITKVDAKTLAVLPNATFQLLDSNKQILNGYIRTSDAQGVLTFERLPNGVYYLEEVKAPNGYTKLSEMIRVEIQGEDVSMQITNPAIVVTGVTNNAPLYLGMAFVSVLGIVLLLRKKDEEDE